MHDWRGREVDHAMQINLRPAITQDFEYCRHLYFSGMERYIRDLKLDMAAHARMCANAPGAPPRRPDLRLASAGSLLSVQGFAVAGSTAQGDMS